MELESGERSDPLLLLLLALTFTHGPQTQMRQVFRLDGVFEIGVYASGLVGLGPHSPPTAGVHPSLPLPLSARVIVCVRVLEEGDFSPP